MGELIQREKEGRERIMIRTRHRRVRWPVRGRCCKSRVCACANQVLAQFFLSCAQVANRDRKIGSAMATWTSWLHRKGLALCFCLASFLSEHSHSNPLVCRHRAVLADPVISGDKLLPLPEATVRGLSHRHVARLSDDKRKRWRVS